MGQTCLATNQIVAGCEKLLQKIVSSSTALCNLQKPDLLQDRFDSWMVTRTKQVARFCCQFHRSLNKFAGHSLLVIWLCLASKGVSMKIAGTRFQFRGKLSKTGTNPLFSSWKCMTPHIPFTVANNTCLWVVKIRLPLAHFLTPQRNPSPPQPKSPQIFLTNLENPPKFFDSPISSNLLKWDKMIEYSPQKTINKSLRILLNI